MRLTFVLFTGICLCGPLSSQTFKCDGRLILGTRNQELTRTYAINFGAFFSINYQPITSYLGNGFDALGFNPKDNYIYAVRQNTNTIVRLRSDGSFETLGSVPIVDELNVYAGDCTPDGRYLCHDNTLDQILVFSVVDNFVLEERLDLFWDPNSVNSGPVTTRMDDFAIDPDNPTVAYAFTYGACEQFRAMEVVVKPAIDASITGAPEYCEREQMLLTAEGAGDGLSFQWSGPNNVLDTSSVFKVASTTPDNAGAYQVIIDNDACQDTAIVAISILPSPTIKMPRLIEADFCDPVILQPRITGDDAVIYTWTPSEGLSCDDCPDPEVRIPILPSYQLHVINETLCTDSTTVGIFFRGDDLIYVPNVFSPNFDGVNDYFQLFPSCVVSGIQKLEIYDRWGQVVFSAGPINPGDLREFWDGQIDGKAAGTGVYLWQTEIELVNGTSRRLTGEVSLLR